MANAQLSNEVTVKTVDLPIPEALSALPNLNMTYHDIRWREPKNLPKFCRFAIIPFQNIETPFEHFTCRQKSIRFCTPERKTPQHLLLY